MRTKKQRSNMCQFPWAQRHAIFLSIGLITQIQKVILHGQKPRWLRPQNIRTWEVKNDWRLQTCGCVLKLTDTQHLKWFIQRNQLLDVVWLLVLDIPLQHMQSAKSPGKKKGSWVWGMPLFHRILLASAKRLILGTSKGLPGIGSQE